MKTILFPLAALTLSSVFAQAAPRPAAQSNYLATRQYYQRLVAGPAPQLSEINLLMGMMPKGGDIHHHYSGAQYVETYLDWAAQQDFCIYRANDAAHGKEQYRVVTKPAPGGDPNCISVDAVRKDGGFYRALISQWSDLDFYNHGQLQVPPDQHFFNTFGYFGAVSAFNTPLGLQLLKRRAKQENVQYIETMLKGAPTIDQAGLAARLDALPPDADDAALLPLLAEYADFIQGDAAAQGAISDYVQGLERAVAGIDDADFTLRLQTYVSRNSAPSKVFSSLVAAFAACTRSPLIVGVNIVGPENGVVALRDYPLHMRMFRFLKQRYPQVRPAMHAGELAPGLVPPEDLRGHIEAAVNVASAERIGHGVDITHEAGADQLLKTLRRRGIAVEINLTSNDFILGVRGAAHPVATYLRHGVPIVLSTDDAGVSRNDLSGEYARFAGTYQPSYDTLKQVVYNSIRYSFLSAADKAAETRKLDQRFTAFEAAVAALQRKD